MSFGNANISRAAGTDVQVTPNQGPNPALPPGAINALSYGAKGDGVTDDTAAVQAAINAAGALAPTNGIVDVWLPPGYEFYLGQFALPSAGGVRVWAYGAAIKPNLNNWANSAWSMFDWTNTGILTGFEIRGGAWLGTGAESGAAQGIFALRNNRGLQDCTFADMKISGWGLPPFPNLKNPTRLRILNNTIIAGDQHNSGNLNEIDVVFDGTATATGGVWILGNDIEGATAAAIDVYGSAAVAARAFILANRTTGAAASTASSNNSGAINFEIGANVAFTNALIALNDIQATNVNAGAYAMLVGNRGAFTGASPQAVKVTHNTISSVTQGILVGNDSGSPEVEVTGNRIGAASNPIVGITTVQSGNKYSTGASQGRATLVAGTVTVSTAEVVANDNILLSRVVPGGTTGNLSVGTITAGTSFVINSSSGTDTSTVFWQIVH